MVCIHGKLLYMLEERIRFKSIDASKQRARKRIKKFVIFFY